jgi:hypothetical protein
MRRAPKVAALPQREQTTCGGPDPLERRMRESGGPQDHAQYGCGCGYLFTANVATSVCCPRCGSGQAW